MIKKFSENEILTDSHYLGALLSLFDCEVSPFLDLETNRRVLKARGNVKEALARISSNEPVGVLDINRELNRINGLLNGG